VGQASSCQWPWRMASTGLGWWLDLADLPLRWPDLASGRRHWRLLSDSRAVAGCVVVSSMRAGSCVCTTMEFWAKAQPVFGWADDCDASGATYLLGGVVCEPIPLYQQCWIMGVNPALDASKASGDGVHSGSLGRHPLLEGVVEESLTATCLLPVSSPTSVVPAVQPAPSEVPSRACVCLCSTVMVCPATLDIAGVVVADALPSLSLASSLADALVLRVLWSLLPADALA
jgi:hypothetical protein